MTNEDDLPEDEDANYSLRETLEAAQEEVEDTADILEEFDVDDYLEETKTLQDFIKELLEKVDAGENFDELKDQAIGLQNQVQKLTERIIQEGVDKLKTNAGFLEEQLKLLKTSFPGLLERKHEILTDLITILEAQQSLSIECLYSDVDRLNTTLVYTALKNQSHITSEPFGGGIKLLGTLEEFHDSEEFDFPKQYPYETLLLLGFTHKVREAIHKLEFFQIEQPALTSFKEISDELTTLVATMSSSTSRIEFEAWNNKRNALEKKLDSLAFQTREVRNIDYVKALSPLIESSNANFASVQKMAVSNNLHQLHSRINIINTMAEDFAKSARARQEIDSSEYENIEAISQLLTSLEKTSKTVFSTNYTKQELLLDVAAIASGQENLRPIKESIAKELKSDGMTERAFEIGLILAELRLATAAQQQHSKSPLHIYNPASLMPRTNSLKAQVEGLFERLAKEAELPALYLQELKKMQTQRIAKSYKGRTETAKARSSYLPLNIEELEDHIATMFPKQSAELTPEKKEKKRVQFSKQLEIPGNAPGTNPLSSGKIAPKILKKRKRSEEKSDSKRPETYQFISIPKPTLQDAIINFRKKHKIDGTFLTLGNKGDKIPFGELNMEGEFIFIKLKRRKGQQALHICDHYAEFKITKEGYTFLSKKLTESTANKLAVEFQYTDRRNAEWRLQGRGNEWAPVSGPIVQGPEPKKRRLR